MKRLLLIGLVGLSLVGCSNSVDYNQTEIPTQDTAPTLEEQRNELREKTRENRQNRQNRQNAIKQECQRGDRYSLGVYSIEREKMCRKYGYKHNN